MPRTEAAIDRAPLLPRVPGQPLFAVDKRGRPLRYFLGGVCGAAGVVGLSSFTSPN